MTTGANLRDYVQHKAGCERGAGMLPGVHTFRMESGKIRTYTNNDHDREFTERDPVCTCGLDAFLDAAAEREQEPVTSTELIRDGYRVVRQRLSEAEATITRLTFEVESWQRWGIIEIAVRNPNVSSYMDHWEGRTLKAAAEVASLTSRIGELETKRTEPSAEDEA